MEGAVGAGWWLGLVGGCRLILFTFSFQLISEVDNHDDVLLPLERCYLIRKYVMFLRGMIWYIFGNILAEGRTITININQTHRTAHRRASRLIICRLS